VQIETAPRTQPFCGQNLAVGNRELVIAATLDNDTLIPELHKHEPHHARVRPQRGPSGVSTFAQASLMSRTHRFERSGRTAKAPPAEKVAPFGRFLEIGYCRDISQLDQLLRGPFSVPPRPPVVAPAKRLPDQSDRSGVSERAESGHRRNADTKRGIRACRLEHMGDSAPIADVLERLERADAQVLVLCLQATVERRYRSRVFRLA
jgi:hypothetical protein